MSCKLPKLAIIVPCYNESEIIAESSRRLLKVLEGLIDNNEISQESYICFVDDGSLDNTWEIIQKFSDENKYIKAIRFACNFGHQKAIMAGMCENIADIYITLDCDLQDDLSAINEMIKKYKNNDADVVYGIRSSRNTDTFIKKFLAQTFYKFSSIMGMKSLYDAADYRLVSNKVVDVLRQHKEYNLYLRALIYQYSFKYDIVHYVRQKRIGGSPKYNFISSFNLAISGITSFSVRPIRIILLLSILILLLSLILSSKTFFACSLNLFATYIVGEYLLASLIETKNRPNYVIYERTKD